MSAFGSVLKEIRESRRPTVSQRELARRLGVPQSRVSQLEAGLRGQRMRSEEVRQVIVGLGVSKSEEARLWAAWRSVPLAPNHPQQVRLRLVYADPVFRPILDHLVEVHASLAALGRGGEQLRAAAE